MNCNMNIFEIMELDADPVYKLLSSLKVNKSVEIEGYTVRKDKYYEVENDEIHIGFHNLTSCYQFVSHKIVTNPQ